MEPVQGIMDGTTDGFPGVADKEIQLLKGKIEMVVIPVVW